MLVIYMFMCMRASRLSKSINYLYDFLLKQDKLGCDGWTVYVKSLNMCETLSTLVPG